MSSEGERQFTEEVRVGWDGGECEGKPNLFHFQSFNRMGVARGREGVNW